MRISKAPSYDVLNDDNDYWLNRISEGLMPIPECGCEVWTFGCTTDGYGHIYYQGNNWRVHRLRYILVCGNTDLDILHKCDVKSCANLNHLYTGDDAANQMDIVNRKWNDNNTHPNGTFTIDQVRHIRNSTNTQREIAKQFNTNQSTIQRIKSRTLYGYIE